MKPFPLLLIATLAAAVGLTGCSSPPRPAGNFHLGDTPEMVETEIGRPNTKQARTGTDGPETVWVYSHYHVPHPTATGWSEVLVPGVHDQNGTEIQKPVTRELYTKEVGQDMLVIFTGGRVSRVEFQTR